MHLLGARAGFALAAAGQLAYLPQQADPLGVALTVVVLAGLAAAAYDPRRGRLLATGLALAGAAASVGALASLRAGFDIWFAPQALIAVGLLMAAGDARARGHDFGVRAGAATAALGASLWLLLDPFDIVSVWLPGNLLSIAGFIAVAASYVRDAPEDEAAEAPA